MRYLIALLLALVIAPVKAADPDFIQFQTPAFGRLVPTSGAWLNVGAGGTGYTLDFGPDGLFFAALFVYTPTGTATWYTAQGMYVEATDAERLSTGVIGRVRSPLYASTGGQCLGCTWQAPVTVDAMLGEAEFRFFSATDGEFRLGAFVIPIKAHALLITKPENVLEKVVLGKWMGAFRGSTYETLFGVSIAAQPTTTYPVQAATEPGQLQGPPPYATQFRLDCTVLCRGVVTAAGRVMTPSEQAAFERQVELVLSYDPVSRRYAAHALNPFANNSLLRRFDVAVRNNGRELYFRAPSYTSVITGNFVGIQEIVLTKLPDDFRPRSGDDGI